MANIEYEDDYCYRYGGGGFTFKDICKACKGDMECINEDGRNTMGINYIYWCPTCGTILKWYDSFKIEDRDWKITKKGMELAK